VTCGLIETEDDASGAEVVAVVGLKVLVCLVTIDGGVFLFKRVQRPWDIIVRRPKC
jgi:hypothetical protein